VLVSRFSIGQPWVKANFRVMICIGIRKNLFHQPHSDTNLEKEMERGGCSDTVEVGTRILRRVAQCEYD